MSEIQPPDERQAHEFQRRPRSWAQKFSGAWRGIREGIQGQTSFWVHLPVGLLVILLCPVLQIPILESSLLVLCVGVVIAGELMNSSIEWLSRSITQQHNDRIRRSLDIASGAVLVLALTAVAVGGLIIGKALWEKLL